MIIAFSAMIIGLLGRNLLGARIAKHIENYFQNNPEAQLLRVEELQSVVQGLINELRRVLHQMKEEPEEHLIGIGLLDYDFIEVVKEPRPWRKYYLVKITY
jgi:signal transduction histidine kinase